MKLGRIFAKCIAIIKNAKDIIKGNYNFSYSQAGEDKILWFLISYFNIQDVTYLDVGSNHPIYGNNTYFLYLKNFKGVLVEPNITFQKTSKSTRPNDKFLNIGITHETHESVLDYYVFSENGLNTFSKKDAEHWENVGMKGVGLLPILEIKKIKVRNINSIISENFISSPTILSLDVEGLDLEILQSLNWDIYSPFVICVETLRYDSGGSSYKDKEIEIFMKKVGYFIYADTYINTIFVHKVLFDGKNKI